MRRARAVFLLAFRTMPFLSGKRILITGVLSNRSIAYGIARACRREGAELAFTYVGERFKERIGEFAREFASELTFDCDVAHDAQIAATFEGLGRHWDGVPVPYVTAKDLSRKLRPSLK